MSPDGPTFVSAICRIGVLLAQVTTEPGLGNLTAKLAHALMIADARATDGRRGPTVPELCPDCAQPRRVMGDGSAAMRRRYDYEA